MYLHLVSSKYPNWCGPSESRVTALHSQPLREPAPTRKAANGGLRACIRKCRNPL
jgi:hypothetical protein